MTVDIAAVAAAWRAAADASNVGDDLEPLRDLLDENCMWTSAGRVLGTGRDEIISGIRRGRTNGWRTHEILELAAAGQFIVYLFRNTWDGRAPWIGAGILQANEDGLVTQMVALDPPRD